MLQNSKITFGKAETYTGRQGWAYFVEVFFEGLLAGTMEDKADGSMPYLRYKVQHADRAKAAKEYAETLWEKADEDTYGFDATGEVLSLICGIEADKQDAAEMESV